MSQTLTYVMGADNRALVDNVQDFHIDWNEQRNDNWITARQWEDGMRQVFVNIKNQDGTPFDLTGCNVWFEGFLPKSAKGDFRVIDDEGYVPIDESAGRFRFDMPKQAFPLAGSYRQAFFRILKNGNSVTTLEFDLKVLADKVIDGLVPKDWIGPFEEIADKLVDDLQKHTDSADKIIADFQQKVMDLVNQLNQQGSTTTSMLTELQNRISELEAKIKQDDLVTKGEFAKLQQSLEAELQQEETKLHGVVDQVADSVNHQFKYLSMGINIADGVDGQTLFNDEYSACQNNLMDFTLIDRVDVPSATATTFTPTSDAVMKSAIDKLHQNGRKILMLKPHLFVGGREIYRENYKPTDITAFFTNWQTFLEREAKICTENDIPVLCIEVEMNTVFSDANFDRIKTLISNLKQKYPDLKLTAACNKFFVEGFMKILSLVDIIGINVYPSYASSIPANVAQMSVPELVPEAAEFMFNSDRLAQKIDDTVLEFHKPIIITEIGIYPFKEGLIQPLLSMDTQDVIDGKVVPDFNVTALAMRAAIEGLAYADSVIGVSWFASGVPMFFKDYYREDAAVPNAAERAWNELSKAYYWEGR